MKLKVRFLLSDNALKGFGCEKRAIFPGSKRITQVTDNVTNELLFEALKGIQNKLSLIANDIIDLKTDMRGVKGHMAAFMQSEAAQDGALASIQARLERIETRLDLVDH